jgi:ribulose-phosphate 3-epimerase
MIIPAILEDNFSEIKNKLEICTQFASAVHIDFIDGNFAENKSFMDFEPFKEYRQTFNLEAHLMVNEPINYLDKLADAGFTTFIGHVEKMSDQVSFVAKGEELGRVSLALDLSTPLDELKVNLEDLDQILLMSVKAGKSGQVFEEAVVEKIKKLRSIYLGKIEIDGGINEDTLKMSKNAGANNFCVTSALFKEDPRFEYQKLYSLL